MLERCSGTLCVEGRRRRRQKETQIKQNKCNNKMIRPAIKITSVETLCCGAGFRDFCFVKMCTNGVSADGKSEIIGWSEYLEERNL